MGSIRGNIGKKFRAAKAHLVGAQQSGSINDLIKAGSDLFPLRRRTRLPEIIDRSILAAFSCVSELIAKGARSNSPDSTLGSFVSSSTQNSHWIRREQDIADAIQTVGLDLFDTVHLNFYERPDETKSLLGDLMILTAPALDASTRLARQIEGKLNLTDSSQLDFSFGNYCQNPYIKNLDRAKAEYGYADNLLFHALHLWVAAQNNAKDIRKVINGKLGDLLTTLGNAYPAATKHIIDKTLAEIQNPRGTESYSHLKRNPKRALKKILTQALLAITGPEAAEEKQALGITSNSTTPPTP